MTLPGTLIFGEKTEGYLDTILHNIKNAPRNERFFDINIPLFLCRYDLRIAETVAIIKLLRACARERNVLKFLVSMF